MIPPIDLTEINSLEDAKEALQTWKISKERAEFIAQALLLIKEPQKEEKENIEKIPTLENANFRIDSTNRKEIISSNGVKVKENPDGDIREYIEGDYKGEQLFTEDSALREAKKAGKRLPASWTTYRDIINKKYEWNYQKFLEWEKMLFAGWRDPDDKTFNYINKVFRLRGADGSNFSGNKSKWNNNGWNRNCGFSVRCLKD